MNDLILNNKAAILNLRSYKTGDLVRLKCGGPTMVVLTYANTPPGETERAVCVWHNDNNGICEAAFPEAVLLDCDPAPLDLKPLYQD